MTETKINKAVAHELAIGFISEISDYIERHKTEYLAYLQATGQTDEYYQKNTEADK